MSTVFEKLCKINKEWDRGSFNILKGLRLMTDAVHGSDLLPGEVSISTLESLAVAMYKNKQSFEKDIESLRVAGLKQANPLQLTQGSLSFAMPEGANITDSAHIFSNLIELKHSGVASSSNGTPFFIETLTASERLHDQLLLDESVRLDESVFKRAPCCKGRPGDGYAGCVLYQIDALITGSLGVFLSKAEIDVFRKSGSMPLDAGSRVCILCYSQMLTCRASLFGSQGIGRGDSCDQAMFFQDLVNCNNGFQSKFMILPGSGGLFPPAPFLSFHPRFLRIALRGDHLYVDESAMWFRPELPGFRQGAAC